MIVPNGGHKRDTKEPISTSMAEKENYVDFYRKNKAGVKADHEDT